MFKNVNTVLLNSKTMNGFWGGRGRGEHLLNAFTTQKMWFKIKNVWIKAYLYSSIFLTNQWVTYNLLTY